MTLTEEHLLLFCLIIIFIGILVYVLISIVKDEHAIRKAYENIKEGDVYKWESRIDDNPFAEPSVYYAVIKDVKVNDKGVYWVQYYDGLRCYIVRTMKLSCFLNKYKLAPKGGEK